MVHELKLFLKIIPRPIPNMILYTPPLSRATSAGLELRLAQLVLLLAAAQDEVGLRSARKHDDTNERKKCKRVGDMMKRGRGARRSRLTKKRTKTYLRR